MWWIPAEDGGGSPAIATGNRQQAGPATSQPVQEPKSPCSTREVGGEGEMESPVNPVRMAIGPAAAQEMASDGTNTQPSLGPLQQTPEPGGGVGGVGVSVWRSQLWSPCPGAAKDPGRVGGTATEVWVWGMMCVSCVSCFK